MALAERHSCKDQIGVYYTGDWTLVNVRQSNVAFRCSNQRSGRYHLDQGQLLHSSLGELAYLQT